MALSEEFKTDITLGKAREDCTFKGNKYRITVLSDVLLRLEYSETGKFNDYPTIFAINRNFAKKPVFTDTEHEKAWFIRVTINLSKNYVQSFWHRNVDGIVDDIPYITKEEQEIWEIVHRLPEKYRIVIEVHYLDGYSIKEIAQILNKKQSTVGTWYERAKKELKKELEANQNG